MEIDKDLFYSVTGYLNVREKIEQKKFREQKCVKIVGLVYNDKRNFSVKSMINDYRDGKVNIVEIDVENGEIKRKECTCSYRYGYTYTCEHIIATIICLAETKEVQKNVEFEKEVKDREFHVFNQIVNLLYKEEMNNLEKETIIANVDKVKIIPKIAFTRYYNELKLEFKIGSKQMYKIKNVSEFYENMIKKSVFKYGEKLKLEHSYDRFDEDSKDIVDFLVKYGEMVKYANEAAKKSNNYSSKLLNLSYVALDGSAIDEFFEIYKNKVIDSTDGEIFLNEKDPKIDFKLEKVNDEKYIINQPDDAGNILIIEGNKHKYIYLDDQLHRCSKEFQNTTLRLFLLLRNNRLEQVAISKEQLASLFSIVLPNAKEVVELKNIEEKEIEKYTPKKLGVKLFLDFDESGNLTLEVKFCYGDIEINPLNDKAQEDFPRNKIEEAKILNTFLKSEFMKDIKNNSFIMTGDENIYNFLVNDINYYMQKYEVLATENFKEKQIRQPQMGTVGVKVENNLLTLNLNEIDIDLQELATIMDKYKLKKKFHKLKDGSFLNLEENKEIEFIDKIVDGMDVDYSEIENGKINLPVQRTLYLNQLLKQLKGTEVVKNKEYKEIVKGFNKELLEEDLQVPESLDKVLRLYQKTGYKWLSVLDKYKFGGVLADDMGLR